MFIGGGVRSGQAPLCLMHVAIRDFVEFTALTLEKKSKPSAALKLN